MTSIRDIDVNNKRIFLRVDFNATIKDGEVTSTNRMKKSLSTIQYLLENNSKVIVATHLGKPKGEIVPELSTIPLATSLAKLLGHQVIATDHIVDEQAEEMARNLKEGEILFLGNLRWEKGEEENDQEFAKKLALMAEVYVNDAFSASHRAHASLDAITNYLPSYAGFLLESEIETLDLLVKNPTKPIVLILGGAKIKDKAGLIYNLAPKVDKILLGGAVATTFLASQGVDVSSSLCEPEMFDRCRDMVKKFSEKIILPKDNVKKDLGDGKFSIMDIGAETIGIYLEEIRNANTIFWNGNLGYSEDSLYEIGTLKIAMEMQKSSGTTIVAGGDTAGFVDSHNLTDGINFISTGGGAALEFLAGKKLPGIVALDRKQNS